VSGPEILIAKCRVLHHSADQAMGMLDNAAGMSMLCLGVLCLRIRHIAILLGTFRFLQLRGTVHMA